MASPELQIYLFGQFRVYRDGHLIPDEQWRTSKNKAVLKVLLTRPGHVVPTETLLESVWPESDPARSLRNLRGRISELRRILEPGIEKASNSSFIETASGGYRFDPANAVIDTERFKSLLGQARQREHHGEIDKAVDRYQEAAELYRGDLALLQRPEGLAVDVVDQALDCRLPLLEAELARAHRVPEFTLNH